MLNQENVDNIKVGRFATSSYFGKKSQILKSGICKYFRRKKFDKYEWCIMEMALFGLKSKGLMTNLVNRLKILIYEEISFDEIDNIINLITILKDIDNYESNDILNRSKLLLEFVNISKKCKRNRCISYINNWWKNKKFKKDIFAIDIKLDKVLKYKKLNDTNELLKLGEMLIYSINNHKNYIFRIFNKMYLLKGKYGRRFRRTDAIYLFWEIVIDKFNDNHKFMNIVNFALNRFYRKNMTERVYFGIWICVFIYRYHLLDWNGNNIKINLVDNKYIEEYFNLRKDIKINEDYVINDWHVNKIHGLAKFGQIGAKVIDEDYGILDYNKCEKMRLYYIKCKTKQQLNNR